MKLKKGSLEAKRFMAKIRAMRSGTKKKATKKKATKKIGATKFIEKNEVKSTKPARTIQITRKRNGTFKKFTSISGVHKDTKSHNVRISVISGIKNDYAEKLIKYVKMLEMNENTLLNLRYKIKNKIDVLNNKIHYMDTNNDIKKIKKHIITLKKHI